MHLASFNHSSITVKMLLSYSVGRTQSNISMPLIAPWQLTSTHKASWFILGSKALYLKHFIHFFSRLPNTQSPIARKPALEVHGTFTQFFIHSTRIIQRGLFSGFMSFNTSFAHLVVSLQILSKIRRYECTIKGHYNITVYF